MDVSVLLVWPYEYNESNEHLTPYKLRYFLGVLVQMILLVLIMFLVELETTEGHQISLKDLPLGYKQGSTSINLSRFI